MRNVGDQPISAKTIERVVHDVNWELAERRDAYPKTDDALAQSPESPPDLDVVECDGGSISTREPHMVKACTATQRARAKPRTPV